VIMGTEYRSGGGKIPPQNGQGFFDPVRSALAADLVMGNLETPLTIDTGASKCAADATECFQFFLPPAYANYLHDGGFRVMNLANNHTNDMGSAGLANTRAALDAAGVGHTGAPNEITIVQVKSAKIAVLGFSIYSWGGNLNNIPAAVNLVKKATTQADIVVIQMQGGAEGADKSHVTPGHEFFVGEDRGDLIAFSHAVIDAGADVVFGHGPHIMRGMEFYHGRLIAYSLGNFCGYGVLNSSGYLGVGGVLRVTLHHDGTWAGGTLVATQMVRGGMVDLDPNKRALGFVGGLSTSDFGAAAARISTADGSISPPASG
jgi:poly-gamma-glutamate capsule biosynthesis protein CapA/YwtB (metallophosphatase superfamily)